MAAELLSLLWNADISRSVCPSFRRRVSAQRLPHISNVSGLPYTAPPLSCAAFFVKVHILVGRAVPAERENASDRLHQTLKSILPG